MNRLMAIFVTTSGFAASFVGLRLMLPTAGWLADWIAVIFWSLAYAAINKGSLAARAFHFLVAAAVCALIALLLATHWFDSGL